jgi:hypothetical protein
MTMTHSALRGARLSSQRPIDEARAGRVHHDPHDTEVSAAVSIAPLTGKLRTAVLRLLGEHPFGLTDDEGARLLNVVYPGADRLTFGRRRQELCRAGLVSASGLRRATPHGRSAIVWVRHPDPGQVPQ